MSRPAQPGDLIADRYELEELLGSGGMSSVFRARDVQLDRRVAVKILHERYVDDAEYVERFRREARAVARLSHPNIVTVIDRGNDDGRQYIVFEHVEGETLKSFIRRVGELEVTTALAYALEIARALAAAHSHLIVHRDVKPQNVLLGNEGAAKITDFGIARTLTEQGLTLDGRVLGTTDYVSPEQALGRDVTVQSDVYSLGIVLYEMLTGEVPFRGESPVAVAMRHVREEVPDVQQRRPGISAATAAVVERACAKDLESRYSDVEAMIADLEEALAIEAAKRGSTEGEVTSVLRTLPAPARRRLPWRMRHPWRWVASLALLGAGIAAAVIFAYGNAEKGTGIVPNVKAGGGLVPVRLGQQAAHDYNPFGTDEEDPAGVGNIIDGEVATTWSTEHYVERTLSPKPGTGVYLDAAPGVGARAVEVQTPTPGLKMAIYGSNRFDSNLPYGDETPLHARGWTLLSPPVTISGQRKRIALQSSQRLYRYYLLWITRLPPESESAEIAEVTLLK